MASSKSKKQQAAATERIISGLAAVVGLDPSASSFEVLRTVAETLGCTVAEDGTTELPSEGEEEEEAPQRKRRRGGASGVKAAAAGGEGEEDLGSEDTGSSGDELEGAEEGSDGEEEEEGPDEEALEAIAHFSPVTIQDKRKQAEVPKQEGITEGGGLFEWLIAPVDQDTFEDAIAEQQVLLVSRPDAPGYYGGLFCKDDIDRLLRAGKLQYQLNIDVVSYSKAGTRQNFNYNGSEEPAGGEPEQADVEVVWRRFDKEECSIRVLHPQRYSDALWRLLARLEGFLQCCVGCNAYLTPAGSQGFAPHWDDVDVFIMQVEGKKRWRLYKAVEPEHVLPRYPSRDFTQEELGECVLDTVLSPGDLLYLPRGTVHQAVTPADTHSLHLTLSTNQLRTWADILGEALPRALSRAAAERVRLRHSLPRDFFDYMGCMYRVEGEEEEQGEGLVEADEMGHLEEDPEVERLKQLRAAFREEAFACAELALARLPLDEVADDLAVQFLKQRLPPVVPAAAGPSGSKPRQLREDSRVRLAAQGIARVVVEEEGSTDGGEPTLLVFHCLNNSRAMHASRPAGDNEEGTQQQEGGAEAEGGAVAEGEENALEFPLGCEEALAALLRSGEGSEVVVGELPETEEGCQLDRLGLAQVLADAGLLVEVP